MITPKSLDFVPDFFKQTLEDLVESLTAFPLLRLRKGVLKSTILILVPITLYHPIH